MIEQTRQNLSAFLRRSFFLGLLVTLPSVLSLWISWRAFDWIDRNLAWLLKGFPVEPIRGTGFVLGLALVVVVGALANNFAGRRLVDLYEGLLERLPVVNQLLPAFRKIAEILLAEDSISYREVVMVEYPRPGSWALAFLAGRSPAPLARAAGEPQLYSVFVPTTPNPTSGFLLLVPESGLRRLAMSVEDGMKLVFSGGLLVPSPAQSDAEVVPAD